MNGVAAMGSPVLKIRRGTPIMHAPVLGHGYRLPEDKHRSPTMGFERPWQ